MNRRLTISVTLGAALAAASCAAPAPTGEEDVVVLGPTRELDTGGSDTGGSEPGGTGPKQYQLGWFFDGNHSGQWEAGETVWASRGSVFGTNPPWIRQDVMENIQEVSGVDCTGKSHPIVRFVLDNRKIQAAGTFDKAKGTLTWWIYDALEAVPGAKPPPDKLKIAEQLTPFTLTIDPSGPKCDSQLFISLNGKLEMARAVSIRRM